jgi:hypothetical protein
MVGGGRTLAPARVVPEAALHALRVTVGQSGVVLGCDGYSAPVLVPIFGPAPVSVAFVGGWWAAQLIVHRCLGHGASVFVDAPDTVTPAQYGALAGLSQWLTLDRLADAAGQQGTAGRVSPAGGDHGRPSRTRPHLVVHDTGPDGPAVYPPPRPWQARLTVLSRVAPTSQQALAQADIVLTQRLDPREAAVVAATLLLPPEFTSQVGVMPNETLAACRAGQVRYLWFTPTGIERQAFG